VAADSRDPRARESGAVALGLAVEGMWRWAEWGSAGPNGVLAFSFYFLFSFLPSQIQFEFKFNSNFLWLFITTIFVQ
jgi:hypothetical protein